MTSFRLLPGKLKRFFKSKACIVAIFAAVCCTILCVVVANTSRVTIVDQNNEFVCTTMKKDVNEILEESKITVGPYDKVTSQSENGKLSAISIARAYPVTVAADGKETTVYLTGGTADDALKAAGITLDKDDFLNVGASTAVAENDKIIVSRVDYEESVETQAIPHEVAYEETSTMRAGASVVVSRGSDGARQIRTVNKYVDGQLVDTDVQEEIVAQPVTEQIMVGTSNMVSQMAAPAGITLDENGVPTQYSSVITGSATAYSAREGAGTASGMRAAVGRVAVNPNLIPYGTRLFIRTMDGSYVYGYAVAADTGSALMSGHAIVDLFFDTYEESCQFGRRNVEIYVLS